MILSSLRFSSSCSLSSTLEPVCVSRRSLARSAGVAPSLASFALRTSDSLPAFCAASRIASTISRSFCGFDVPQHAMCSGVHCRVVLPFAAKSAPSLRSALIWIRSPARTLLRRSIALSPLGASSAIVVVGGEVASTSEEPRVARRRAEGEQLAAQQLRPRARDKAEIDCDFERGIGLLRACSFDCQPWRTSSRRSPPSSTA